MNGKVAKRLRRNARIAGLELPDYGPVRKGRGMPVFNPIGTKRGLYRGLKRALRRGVKICDMVYEV